MSVITIKRAYPELEHEGVIVTRQGKGSFVAEGADLRTRLRLDHLDAHLAAAADADAMARIGGGRVWGRGCSGAGQGTRRNHERAARSS